MPSIQQHKSAEQESSPRSMGLRQLNLSFNLPLHPKDIRLWRGAWAELAGHQHGLFHNHLGEKDYHYRYPLVQYRVRRNQAAMVVFNEAIEVVQQVLAERDWQLNWKGKPFELRIADLQLREPRLSFLDTPQNYRISYWLPFNQKNFDRWQKTEGLMAQVKLLNSILVGQLLSFFTGMNWQLPQRLEAEIVHIHRSGKVMVHGTKRPAIDIVFRSNVSLPGGIGLGKAIAFGFGQTYPLRRPRPTGEQGAAREIVL